MRLLSKFRYYHFDWLILFLGSFLLRLININFGLPFEHHPDEEGFFGFVDQSIDSGNILSPGVYSYGGIHYYLLTLTSLLARTFIHVDYIREYEILFSRVCMALIMSVSIIVIYEISRKINPQRFSNFIAAAFTSIAIIHVIFSQYTAIDALISLGVLITVYLSLIFLKKKDNKKLFYVFIAAGLTISLKISYLLLMIIPISLFFFKEKNLITTRIDLRKRIIGFIRLTKYLIASALFFFIGNIFEIPHFITWLGRNHYFYQTYSTPDYFYFKLIKENYFDHLWSILKLTFGDFFVLTSFTGVITAVVLMIFLYRSFVLFKHSKGIFFIISLFSIIFILFAASRKVFLVRTILPIFPLIVLTLFSDTKINKIHSLLYKGMIALLFCVVLISNLKIIKDISNKQAEKQIMTFIDSNQGQYALPYSFKSPSLEYAIGGAVVKPELSSYSFFKNNKNRLLYYNNEEDLNNIINKIDYIVINKQMLQSLYYNESNRLKLEPSFSMVDIFSEEKTLLFLKEHNFLPILQAETSSYEMISKYEPASLNMKKIIIYKKNYEKDT